MSEEDKNRLIDEVTEKLEKAGVSLTEDDKNMLNSIVISNTPDVIYGKIEEFIDKKRANVKTNSSEVTMMDIANDESEKVPEQKPEEKVPEVQDVIVKTEPAPVIMSTPVANDPVVPSQVNDSIDPLFLSNEGEDFPKLSDNNLVKPKTLVRTKPNGFVSATLVGALLLFAVAIGTGLGYLIFNFFVK